MDKFIKFFDDFTFHARIVPVLTAMFPLIILCIFKGFIYKNILDVSSYILVIFIFVVLASKVARECGKHYEAKMYDELGEQPTTIILRYSDSTIDKVTKTRYHKILNEKVKEVNLPLNPDEENKESDIMYSSSMTYLRKYANSNRNAEPRVYQELKEYNYWRNLYGCKWPSILVYTLIASREIILIDSFNIKNIFMNPYPKYIAFLLMIIGIIVMCIFVNKNTVKRKAFDYAKTLAEVCEGLSE